MKDFLRYLLNILPIVLIILFVLYFIGAIGFLIGYNSRIEDAKRNNCKFEYGYKPQSEIIGDCLKYFKPK